MSFNYHTLIQETSETSITSHLRSCAVCVSIATVLTTHRRRAPSDGVSWFLVSASTRPRCQRGVSAGVARLCFTRSVFKLKRWCDVWLCEAVLTSQSRCVSWSSYTPAELWVVHCSPASAAHHPDEVCVAVVCVSVSWVTVQRSQCDDTHTSHSRSHLNTQQQQHETFTQCVCVCA